MNISRTIRELAKSNKFQTIYIGSKEGTLNLFNNKSDYTDLQILFINYLSFYNNLYLDIATSEVEEIVLKDHIYEDAWTYYKRKQKVKELVDSKNKLKKSGNNSEGFKKAKTKNDLQDKKEIDKIKWNFNKKR